MGVWSLMALMELESGRGLVIDGIDGVGNYGRGSRERERAASY